MDDYELTLTSWLFRESRRHRKQRQPISEADLAPMRLIDEYHLKHPYYGSRRIRDWLEDQGQQVDRKRVQRLMRQMDITAFTMWGTRKYMNMKLREEMDNVNSFSHIWLA